MHDVRYTAGILRGTAAAGPVFLVAIGLVTLATTVGPIAIRPDAAMVAVVGIAALSVPVGAVLALVPVTLGTALLAAAGRGNAGLRLPVAWAVIGGLAAGLAMVAIDGPGSDGVGRVALVLTGAICALLARSGVTWDVAPYWTVWRHPPGD